MGMEEQSERSRAFSQVAGLHDSSELSESLGEVDNPGSDR